MGAFGQAADTAPVMARKVAETFTGALFARAGERAVQHCSSGDIESLVVVPQAAGDLAVVDEPGSWSERVAVVSEPCQDLAGPSPHASCCAVHGSLNLTLASSASTARSSAVRCRSRS